MLAHKFCLVGGSATPVARSEQIGVAHCSGCPQTVSLASEREAAAAPHQLTCRVRCWAALGHQMHQASVASQCGQHKQLSSVRKERKCKRNNTVSSVHRLTHAVKKKPAAAGSTRGAVTA